MITVEEALEGSTPLARKVALLGPASTPEQLVGRMRAAIPMLTEEEKIETLNAHPRIGEDPAKMSARSRQEQGSEYAPELHRLNTEYEQKFGFRFVVFVDRRPRSKIVEVLKQRLQRTREQEMATGLEAIVDIAEDRLRK